MSFLPRRMLAILMWLPLVSPYYMAINTDVEPRLALWNQKAVDWAGSRVSVLVDTSVAIRINARGLFFIQSKHVDLREAIPCARRPFALCQFNNFSLVLPMTPPRVQHRGLCAKSRHRVLTQEPFYDISVCDLKAGMDILWSANMVSVDWHLALPQYLYVAVALMVLFLVVSLGQNLMRLMGDSHAETYPLMTELVCMVLVVALVISHDPWRVWVTDEDRFLFMYVVLYIICYLLRHGFELYHRHIYSFNVIVACLILTTARLYGTFETPYSTIFLVLLLSRLFHKLHSETAFPFLMGCDALLIGFYYGWCFCPTFFDPNEAPVYLIGVLFLTLKAGEYTSLQERLQALPERDLVHSVTSVGAQYRDLGANRAHSGNAWDDPHMLKLFDMRLK